MDQAEESPILPQPGVPELSLSARDQRPPQDSTKVHHLAFIQRTGRAQGLMTTLTLAWKRAGGDVGTAQGRMC